MPPRDTSYAYSKPQIIQDVVEDSGGSSDSDVPSLTTHEGYDSDFSDEEEASVSQPARQEGVLGHQWSPADSSDDDDKAGVPPHRRASRQGSQNQPLSQPPAPGKQHEAEPKQPEGQQGGPMPAPPPLMKGSSDDASDADSDDDMPGLVSDNDKGKADYGDQSEGDLREGLVSGDYSEDDLVQQIQSKPRPKSGEPFIRGFIDDAYKNATPERKSQPYAAAGAEVREKVRRSRLQAQAPPPPAPQFEAAQQRKKKGAPEAAQAKKEKVEQVEAELAQLEELKAALKVKEEQRKALRKKMGLDEVEEVEVEDPVLGEYALGAACTKQHAEGEVKASHSDHYGLRCSAGHRLFSTSPAGARAQCACLMPRATSRWCQARTSNSASTKRATAKSVCPECDGILVFIEGPNKYPILNIEEEVRKEQNAQQLEQQEEDPAWERHRQQQQKERRFKFKKGKGKKAANDDEEEPAAANPSNRKIQRMQQQQQQQQQEEQQMQEQQQEMQADSTTALSPSANAAAAAAAVEEIEEPSAPTPALPDDQLLRAIKRHSSEEDLRVLGARRKAKDKGKGPARDAGIEYGDSKADKRKKKGLKLVIDTGLSLAEQRRKQLEESALLGEEELGSHNGRRPQQTLEVSPLEFPDLEEAQQIAQERRGEDAERAARDLYSSSLLSALRSFKAGEFRPDDPNGPLVLLLENLDYRRMPDEEGVRPEMFLRSTFSEYGPVKELRMYEACKASLVAFRNTGAAYKAYMLLSQRVLLHSRLTAMVLKRMPGETEVEELAERLQEEARRKAEGWDEEEAGSEYTEEAGSASGSYYGAAAHAPLYAEELPPPSRPFSGLSAVTSGSGGQPSFSITIPGTAATSAPGAGSSASRGVPLFGGASGTGVSLGTGGYGLKPSAREFVPGTSSSSTLSGGHGGLSPLAATATTIACTAGTSPATTTTGFAIAPSAGGAAGGAGAGANGGLRVAASEFRPQQAEQQADVSQDPLTLKFLSGQLIPTNATSFQAYLDCGEEPFGLPVAFLDKPGLVTKGTMALLMCDVEEGSIYGVWAAHEKYCLPQREVLPLPNGEVVTFQLERSLPPLPLQRVSHLMQRQDFGRGLKLPQKLAAANIREVMVAMLELQSEQERAQLWGAARFLAAPVSRDCAPSANTSGAASSTGTSSRGLQPLPPHMAGKADAPAGAASQQQEQQREGRKPLAEDMWEAAERLRREQEERDAELARQMQEQLIAEAQLEERQRLEEDARMAEALHRTTAAAAAAASPPAPRLVPAAPARPAAGPGLFANFSSLFPGQRPPGAGATQAATPAAPVPTAAAAAAATLPPPLGAPAGAVPPPGAPAAAVPPPRPAAAGSAPRPYRPTLGGYRPPMRPAAPAATAASAAAAAAGTAPATSAGPTQAEPAAATAPASAAASAADKPTMAAAEAAGPAAPPPAASAAPPAAGAPPVLKNPCVQCKQRESVNIWIPCGHHGHCPECLADTLPLPEKLTQFPACLLCGMKAQYYIRMFA